MDGLRLTVLMFPFVGAQIVIGNFFQSIGKVKISIFLSLTRQLLYLLPCLLLFPHWWGLKGNMDQSAGIGLFSIYYGSYQSDDLYKESIKRTSDSG